MAADLYDGKPHAEEMICGEPMIPVAGAKVFRFHQLTGTVLKLPGPSFDYVIERLPKVHSRAA
jgi:hypothetical protein